MSRFEIESSTLIILRHLKAKVPKIVRGKENIVEKDDNQYR